MPCPSKNVMMACVSIKCPLQLWLNPHPAWGWEVRRLPHQDPPSPPHKLQHFEMQLWISEQRHQSQFLLIFIERSGSRCHLYIREPAVIKRLCVDRGGYAFSISPSVTLDVFALPPPVTPLPAQPLKMSRRICMYKYVKVRFSQVAPRFLLCRYCVRLWKAPLAVGSAGS